MTEPSELTKPNELPSSPLAEHYLQDSAKRHQYQHEFALAGFKTLILLNGGAIISLLTYLGHSTVRHVDQLSTALAFYVVGLVTVVLAYLAAYASQGAFLNASLHEAYTRLNLGGLPGNHFRKGMLAIIFGVGLTLLSLSSFAAGSWLAMKALT